VDLKPKPAYLVLAHKRPDLLSRLLDTLGPAPTAVHVDAKSDMALGDFARRSNVTLAPRRLCHWGLYGIVAASLDALPWFLASDASHLILLSGQCYPLVSQTRVQQHLARLGARSQIRMLPFPIEAWGPAGGYERVQHRYFPSRSQRPRRLTLAPRRMPHGLHPHGGSAFWSLSRKHAAYVLGYLGEHPAVARFYRTTLAPDEMMLQTILANSPHAAEVVSAPLNYSVFKPNHANPEILGVEDLGSAKASGALFCRKFEAHAVLDRLDAMIREDSRRPSAPVIGALD
jgi:hypothetical protein